MIERIPSTRHRQTFRRALPIQPSPADKCGPECGCTQEDAITTEITVEEME